MAENSRIAEHLVSERGWPAERVPVIFPCGRPQGEFPAPAQEPTVRARLRHELGLGPDDVVFLTAARMHPQKRPLDLVELARRAVDLGRVSFLIVGGGELESSVDAAIAASGARVRRLPFRSDIPDLIVAADVGCLVSDYEGLPVFLLECLQAGRPFLGTDVGDLGRVLTATGAGLVVETPGDLAALELAVRRLVDPATREDAGGACTGRLRSLLGRDLRRALRRGVARRGGGRNPVTARLTYRLQRMARDHDQLARRPLRLARRTASLLLHRARALAGRQVVPRVEVDERPAEGKPLSPGPAVVVRAADRAAGGRWLAGQTEKAATLEGEAAADARFLLQLEGDPGRLPATHLEALLLVTAAEDLEWAVSAWSAPAPGRFGPSGDLARDPEVAEASLTLLRLPQSGRRRRATVLGRAVPHIVGRARLAETQVVRVQGPVPAGPHHLRATPPPGRWCATASSGWTGCWPTCPRSRGPAPCSFSCRTWRWGGRSGSSSTCSRGSAAAAAPWW